MITAKMEKFQKATARVRTIKLFHKHIAVFILGSMFMILSKIGISMLLNANAHNLDPNINSWLNWNIIISIALWLIVLVIHGLITYKIKFDVFKKWEERKIREILEKDSFLSENQS
tara:strand:- start:210938 stop:211285 length:348 start_codon:yes stop_codon:yes gene_type:complete